MRASGVRGILIYRSDYHCSHWRSAKIGIELMVATGSSDIHWVSGGADVDDPASIAEWVEASCDPNLFVRPEAVGIAMLATLFASDNNDQRMISWRDDTALLLSTKSRMNIVAAVIEATNFKSPAHFPSSK
jgi:hypothetical protein